MQIRAKLFALLLVLLTMLEMAPPVHAAATPSAVDSLVQNFPTLDELETHLGSGVAAEVADSPANLPPNAGGAQASVYPVSTRWFTAAQPATPFATAATARNALRDKPLTSLLADLDTAQLEARTIGKEISRQNNLPLNKYLIDRWSAYARTDYGTDITGLFVHGVGFGSTEQTLRQSYGTSYSLPLLQRFSRSTNWTRVLSGWTISSDFGVMPLINPTLQLRELLNNLQVSWSVALSYDLSGRMLRRIQDGQYDQEAALNKALGHAAATREELLRRMALRVDALSAKRPVRDTRLTSLRELYPQFELYQARYEQASSCDERMESFFTLKGLALSLLTLAGYDHSESASGDLLQTWKRARFAGCGKT